MLLKCRQLEEMPLLLRPQSCQKSLPAPESPEEDESSEGVWRSHPPFPSQTERMAWGPISVKPTQAGSHGGRRPEIPVGLGWEGGGRGGLPQHPPGNLSEVSGALPSGLWDSLVMDLLSLSSLLPFFILFNFFLENDVKLFGNWAIWGAADL